MEQMIYRMEYDKFENQKIKMIIPSLLYNRYGGYFDEISL